MVSFVVDHEPVFVAARACNHLLLTQRRPQARPSFAQDFIPDRGTEAIVECAKSFQIDQHDGQAWLGAFQGLRQALAE